MQLPNGKLSLLAKRSEGETLARGSRMPARAGGTNSGKADTIVCRTGKFTLRLAGNRTEDAGR